VLAANELNNFNDGTLVKVAGLVLVRQRPGTASGICFITIEDETGVANLVVFQKLFEKYRKEIVQSRLLMVEGKLQKEGKVIHVIVKHCYNVSGLLQQLSASEKDTPSVLTLSRADEKDGDQAAHQDPRTQVRKMVQAEIFPAGRNFK
jgi:error-prone DNA polymerase